MKRLLSYSAGLAALLLSIGHAGADTLTVTSATVGGAPTGAVYANFDSLPLGTAGGTSEGITVSFVTDAMAVQGTTSNYAAPYLSNGNGALFGDPTNGPDTTTYITSGSNGSVAGAEAILTFSSQEEYFGLLWGSVDSYNTLSFYEGGVNGTLVGTVTGAEVTGNDDGDQGVDGTYYVNINSSADFDTVVASSTQYAFEFDNVAYNATNLGGGGATPLPASLWLFGTVLGGAGFLMRRRRSGMPASMA